MSLVVGVEPTARASLLRSRRVRDAAVQSRSSTLVLVRVSRVGRASDALQAAVAHHHYLAARLRQVGLLVFVEVRVLRHFHIHNQLCGLSTLLSLALSHVWLGILVDITKRSLAQSGHGRQT